MSMGFKKATLAAVAALSVVGLAACGSSAGGEATGGETTLKIGVITAMSGPSAVYGEAITRGAELAVEEINEAGGIEGYNFEIVVEDHANDPDSSVTATQKLLTVDGVRGMLSSFTAPTLAARPLACEREIPVLNGGAVGAALIGQECLYNTVANVATMYPLLLDWAIKEYDAERVATIFWNDEAGNAANDEASASCTRAGCEVVAAESHEVGATDLGVQLARIKSADPDLLVVGSWGDDLGYIVKGARDIGLEIPIVGNDYTPNALEIAGAEGMKNYNAVLDRFDPTIDNSNTKAFVEAYREKWDSEPTQFSANYYEHIKYIYADAVRHAVKNGDDPAEPGVLMAALQELIDDGHAFQSLYGESMSVNSDGTVSKPFSVYAINDDGSISSLVDFEG